MLPPLMMTDILMEGGPHPVSCSDTSTQIRWLEVVEVPQRQARKGPELIMIIMN